MWSITSKAIQRQIQRQLPQQVVLINQTKGQFKQQVRYVQSFNIINKRDYSQYNKNDSTRQNQTLGQNQEFKQLPENKSFFQKFLHFFTYTLRYGLLSPLQRKIFRIFGYSREPEQKQAWYQSMWSIFSGKKQKQAWYSKFNVFRSIKEKVVQRVLTLFGFLLFIYILAKSIPKSFRSYKLRQQEIELENKRLEVEKLRLELELRQKSKKN